MEREGRRDGRMKGEREGGKERGQAGGMVMKMINLYFILGIIDRELSSKWYINNF